MFYLRITDNTNQNQLFLSLTPFWLGTVDMYYNMLQQNETQNKIYFIRIKMKTMEVSVCK